MATAPFQAIARHDKNPDVILATASGFPKTQTPMHNPKTMSLILALAPLAPAIPGCTIFEQLPPSLTSAPLTLLVELEDLLRQYESASIAENPSPRDELIFNASQDALYRNISDLLRLCHAQIPASTLHTYEDRLPAASARRR